MKILIKFNILKYSDWITVQKTLSHKLCNFIIYLDKLWIMTDDEFDVINFCVWWADYIAQINKLKLFPNNLSIILDIILNDKKYIEQNCKNKYNLNLCFKTEIDVPMPLDKRINNFIHKFNLKQSYIFFNKKHLYVLFSSVCDVGLLWYSIVNDFDLIDHHVIQFMVVYEIKSILNTREKTIGIIYDVNKHNNDILKWYIESLKYKITEHKNFMSGFINYKILKQNVCNTTTWMEEQDLNDFIITFITDDNIKKLFICLNAYRLHYLKHESFFKNINILILSLEISQKFLNEEHVKQFRDVILNKIAVNDVHTALSWYYFFLWNNAIFASFKHSIMISSKSDVLYFRKFFFKWMKYVELFKMTSVILKTLQQKIYFNSVEYKFYYEKIISQYCKKFLYTMFSKKILKYYNDQYILYNNMANIMVCLNFLTELEKTNMLINFKKIIKRFFNLIKSIDSNYEITKTYDMIELSLLQQQYQKVTLLNKQLDRVVVKNNVKILRQIQTLYDYFYWLQLKT